MMVHKTINSPEVTSGDTPRTRTYQRTQGERRRVGMGSEVGGVNRHSRSEEGDIDTYEGSRREVECLGSVSCPVLLPEIYIPWL